MDDIRKGELLILMGNKFLGWLTLIIILLCMNYSLIKIFKIHNSNFKVNLRRFLDWHCYLGLILTIMAIIHVGKNFYSINLSIGFICLFLMCLLSLSGIILKYVKNLPSKYKKTFKYIHIILTLSFVFTLILHILEYHILY